MSRYTDIEKEEQRLAFVKEAAAYLEEHPKKHSYTSGSVSPGKWFAMRCHTAVMVFKIDEQEEIVTIDGLLTDVPL